MTTAVDSGSASATARRTATSLPCTTLDARTELTHLVGEQSADRRGVTGHHEHRSSDIGQAARRAM
ncbi:MAG: hypothetical protein R2697_16405 [Ilumatobacteraceae bacterium]